MSNGTLYDDDIVLWSEQQAAALRRLAKTRQDLPNELDLANVIEEIEGVGNSELDAVEGLTRAIYVHLIKIAAVPDAKAVRHWRAEIVAFHNGLGRKIKPSMHHRIDLDQVFKRALREANARLLEDGQPSRWIERAVLRAKVAGPPIGFDALSAEELDVDAILRGWAAQDPPS